MSRFIGVRNNRIFVVSNAPFVSETMLAFEVPDELQDVTPSDIITKFRFARGVLSPKRPTKPGRELKVAFVGNWKMRCGISSYSEQLWPAVMAHVGESKFFIEHNTHPTGPMNVIGGMTVDSSLFVPCWTRGGPIDELVKLIKEYNPDVIHIQHEFGLWANARHWLSLMNQLSEFAVFVTMHSVFHHKDKTIVEAAIPNIIVHLEGAKQVLKVEKRISGDVTVIPHGCFSVEKERLWNFYKSDHTVIQWGFGFKYKGWEVAIQAIAILKKKFPDVFFTGLFSESPFNVMEHQIYFNELMELVEQLGIQENVAIIRGFQSDEVIDSFMKTNRIGLFPYISHPNHEVFGASGAARVVMAKGIPVVTTSVNHFSDLPTIKADTPIEMAQAIEQLFDDKQSYKNQIEIQQKFLDDNSWENVALQHIKLFEGK